jgi:septation ring formation regulator EzrA
MRPDRIQQVQDLLADSPEYLSSVLALRDQLLTEIQAIKTNYPIANTDRLLFYEKQLRDVDMALGEARTFILGFNQSLSTIQEIVEAKLNDPESIAKEKARLRAQPMVVVNSQMGD